MTPPIDTSHQRVKEAVTSHPTTLLLLACLLVLYTAYWRRKFQYWEALGVPHEPGSFPLGSLSRYPKPDLYVGDLHQELYEKFPNEPIFGFYNLASPLLVLRDPELIRVVLAKEFSLFRDKNMFKPSKEDFAAHHLFLLDGEKWRALRVKMTPVFSSGKLKAMFPLFLRSAQRLEEVLDEKDGSEVDVKDLTSRFSMDVICSCAFGLETDSLRNDSDPFRTHLVPKPDAKRPLRLRLFLLLWKYFPFLRRDSAVRITRKEAEQFMYKVVRDTVAERERTGERRNDFIDLLMECKKKGNLLEEVKEFQDGSPPVEPVVMTLEVMTAQCSVFFFAGHETSSSVKTFCLYELAHNEEVQERLFAEIQTCLTQNGGLTYQAVQQMEYLDMVVSETMRKYPTLAYLQRCAVTQYRLPTGQVIPAGQKVIVPTFCLHRDPQLYPDPDRFDPERFAKPAVEERHPFAYLPFGEGPRICIGMRFGMLQTKIGIITFLKKFKVLPSNSTPYPIKLKGILITVPSQPIRLKIVKRS